MDTVTLYMSPAAADEVRQAIMETRNEWSSALDTVTKQIQYQLQNPWLFQNEGYPDNLKRKA